jgi:hypothetical protein
MGLGENMSPKLWGVLWRERSCVDVLDSREDLLVGGPRIGMDTGSKLGLNGDSHETDILKIRLMLMLMKAGQVSAPSEISSSDQAICHVSYGLLAPYVPHGWLQVWNIVSENHLSVKKKVLRLRTIFISFNKWCCKQTFECRNLGMQKSRNLDCGTDHEGFLGH